MKKSCLNVLLVLLGILILSTTVFAYSEVTPTLNGTATPFGVYGEVDNIGLGDGPMPFYIVFGTDVTLASGKSFTSYQYEVDSSCQTVLASIWAKTNGTSFSVSLYGSNTIGGAKTYLGAANSYFSDGSQDDEKTFQKFSNPYKYYNVVVKNTSSKSGVASFTISAD